MALFPGALGDLLCCWPALEGLRRETGAALTLVAREAWFDALPEGAVTARSIDRREIADLFGSGPLRDETRSLLEGCTRVESWTGHGDDNFAARLAEASRAAVAVHPFRAFRPGEHAALYYARCVGVAAPALQLPVRRSAAQWADALWARHALGADALVIHAGSGSMRKNWQGMAASAAAWRSAGGQVIVLMGPAESGLAPVPHDVALRGEPLDRIAAVLARGRLYLGNDSGISHLAGLLGARGIAAFGPTDPGAWRPLGSGVRVLHAAPECSHCGGERFCTHRLAVADVLAALRAIARR